MLRTIKAHMPEIRLIPGYVTYTAGVPSLTRHSNSIKTVTDVGTGQVGLALSQIAGGTPLFAIASSEVDDNYVHCSVSPTVGAVEFTNLNGSAVATDSNFHFMIGVTDLRNAGYSSYPEFAVVADYQDSRIVAVDITGSTTPTFVAGSPPLRECSISRTSIGLYVITFNRPFAKTPVVLATGIGLTRVTVKSSDHQSITIRITQSGSLADADVSLIVMGGMSKGKARAIRSAKSNWRRSRIIPFKIESSVVTKGLGPITAGTISGGDYTLNMVRNFARQPQIFSSCNGSLYSAVQSRSVSSISLRSYNSSHVKTAATFLSGFMFGQQVVANEESF